MLVYMYIVRRCWIWCDINGKEQGVDNILVSAKTELIFCSSWESVWPRPGCYLMQLHLFVEFLVEEIK